MNEEIIKILDEQDWDTIILNLTAYAIWLTEVKYRSLPESTEPEDLVMDVIEKVYSGVRNWNPESDPDFFAFLKSAVQSHLNNKLYHGKHSHRLTELKNDVIAEGTDTEDNIYFQNLHEKILVAIGGDAEVCLVYKGLKDGLKPDEISDDYGVTIEVVRNAQKRLRRIVLKVIPSKKRNKKLLNET